jgi:hypothetical protein
VEIKEMALRLKDLKGTRSFYNVELEKGDLAGEERNSYLKALELIEGFIEREKEAGEKERIINLLPKIR